MRDERSDVDLLVCQELDERFHVARFRPAHMADGIVATLLFVRHVIAAGAIGARNAEVELFFVVGFALNLHAHRANGDDDCAISCDGGKRGRRPIS